MFNSIVKAAIVLAATSTAVMADDYAMHMTGDELYVNMNGENYEADTWGFKFHSLDSDGIEIGFAAAKEVSGFKLYGGSMFTSYNEATTNIVGIAKEIEVTDTITAAFDFSQVNDSLNSKSNNEFSFFIGGQF